MPLFKSRVNQRGKRTCHYEYVLNEGLLTALKIKLDGPENSREMYDPSFGTREMFHNNKRRERESKEEKKNIKNWRVTK